MDCNSDEDCPGTKICLTKTRWFKEDQDGCVCSLLYGWTGDDCGRTTGVSIFFLASATIQMVFAIVLFLLCIRIWHKFKHFYRGFWKSSTLTYYLVLVSLFFLFLGRLGIILIITSPEKHTAFVDSFNSREKTHTLDASLEKVATGVATGASLIALLNTILCCKLWL